jgi:exosome complex exonuclease RRP6
MYQRREPIKYLPYDSTRATLVDTEEAMEEMLEELKKAKEIAIDLEHHDQRTYIGVVCLMQISTREKDWIVDTLKPWRRRLESLNEVLTDPSILKVWSTIAGVENTLNIYRFSTAVLWTSYGSSAISDYIS